MVKIGRNDKCPCGSGLKYKKCCGLNAVEKKGSSSPENQMKITLMSAVQVLQQDAAAKNVICRELGVFFFFTTVNGDAWVLEMTEQDAIQVASNGVAMTPPIDEKPETIEINWSHSYELKEKQLEITSYKEKTCSILDDAPAQELNAAMRRIRKRFTKEQLDQVHLAAPVEDV